MKLSSGQWGRHPPPPPFPFLQNFGLGKFLLDSHMLVKQHRKKNLDTINSRLLFWQCFVSVHTHIGKVEEGSHKGTKNCDGSASA